MSVPVPVAPLFDFSDWQATHPTQPLPGTNVDAEFANGYTTINNLIARLALIQRDDGALFNGIVTMDAMDPAVIAAIEDIAEDAGNSAANAAAAQVAAAAAQASAEAAQASAEASDASAQAGATASAASATAAAVSEAAADASADIAAAAAAVMPPLPGDPGKALVVNPAGDGYIHATSLLFDVAENAWSAGGFVVRNAGPAAQANDLTTRQDVQSMISGSGAVPPPGLADIDKVLTATAENAFSWQPSQNEVISVFGRSGIVVQQAGDYTAAQITNVPAGGIAANTVQAAINELDGDVAAKADAAAVTAALAGKQNLDAMLTALAALNTVNDRGLYFTGADTPALFTLTGQARNLLDDADQATMRGTLGLGTAAVLNVGVGANQVVQLNASSQLPAVSGALLTNLPAGGAKLTNIRVYTANATWNKPANLSFIVVDVVGAGGGSGGVPTLTAGPTAAVGQPGGAGGYSRKLIQAASLGATVAVTVGAAGAAGAVAGSGGTGGTSSFGAFASATGGVGGVAGTLTTSGSISEEGALGGVGSGGDLNLAGQAGGAGLKSATSTAGTLAGHGGHSYFGAGGNPNGTNVPGVSPPAGSYGAGAAGAACRGTSGGSQPGAAGAAGLVLVYEYTT